MLALSATVWLRLAVARQYGASNDSDDCKQDGRGTRHTPPPAGGMCLVWSLPFLIGSNFTVSLVLT